MGDVIVKSLNVIVWRELTIIIFQRGVRKIKMQRNFLNLYWKNIVINAGFIVWKNCQRAADINRMWINKPTDECRDIADKHPRQQNVFDKCILPNLKQGELGFLDHNVVGMIYSSFISQTKNTREGWISAGKPLQPVDVPG